MNEQLQQVEAVEWTMQDYLNVVLRRRWIIIIIAVLIFIGVSFYTFTRPDRYYSSSTFSSEQSQGIGSFGLEFFSSRRARVPYRVPDTAAGRGNLRIALALQPHLELVAAPSAEAEVGVAVDQPGDYQPPVAVDAIRAVRQLRYFRLGAGPANLPIFEQQRCMVDQAGMGLRITGRAGCQLADVAQEGGHARSPISLSTALASTPALNSPAQVSESVRTS